MYVRTDIIDGCAVSRLERLAPGESPPVWAGEDRAIVAFCQGTVLHLLSLKGGHQTSTSLSQTVPHPHGTDFLSCTPPAPMKPYGGISYQDPRDEIQGGQWRGVLGGVHFAGEALATGYGGLLAVQ